MAPNLILFWSHSFTGDRPLLPFLPEHEEEAKGHARRNFDRFAEDARYNEDKLLLKLVAQSFGVPCVVRVASLTNFQRTGERERKRACQTAEKKGDFINTNKRVRVFFFFFREKKCGTVKPARKETEERGRKRRPYRRATIIRRRLYKSEAGPLSQVKDRQNTCK